MFNKSQNVDFSNHMNGGKNAPKSVDITQKSDNNHNASPKKSPGRMENYSMLEMEEQLRATGEQYCSASVLSSLHSGVTKENDE